MRAIQLLKKCFRWRTAGRRAGQRPSSTSRRNGGFTLLEVLIAVAIVATLAALAVPAYSAYIERARLTATIKDMRTIEGMILAFELDQERLPETLEEAGVNMVDSWGNPYQYILIRGKELSGKDKISPRKDKFLHPLNSDYDLYSMGADGLTQLALTAKASHDDIIRAADGAFFGLAINY